MVCAKSSSSVRSAAALGLVYIAACGPGSANTSGLSGGGDPIIDSTTTTSSDATSAASASVEPSMVSITVGNYTTSIPVSQIGGHNVV